MSYDITFFYRLIVDFCQNVSAKKLFVTEAIVRKNKKMAIIMRKQK